MKARGFVCDVGYRRDSQGCRRRVAEIRVGEKMRLVVPPPGRSLTCGDMVEVDIPDVPGSRPTTLVA